MTKYKKNVSKTLQKKEKWLKDVKKEVNKLKEERKLNWVNKQVVKNTRKWIVYYG